MYVTRTMILALSGTALGFAACAQPAERTTMASQTTTQRAGGGEMQTNVHETRVQASNGATTDNRTVTTEQTTPAQGR
jgi:hypothetical protein